MTLTCDPSLTAFGWAVVDNLTIIDFGCIETEKDANLQAYKDTVRRLTILYNGLYDVLRCHPINEVCFEVPAGSKSARAGAALGQVHGVILTFCLANKIPFKYTLAGAVKKKLVGDDASKQDLLEVVKKTFINPEVLTKKQTKNQLFAASDALAVYLSLK